MSLSRSRAAAVLALLLAATACTAAPEGPTSDRHSTAPPPFSRQARQLELPLDAYASNDDNIHAIEDAQDILMRRCMNRLGKEWKVLPRVSARDIEPQNLRRYGVIEPEAARRYGYHPRPEPESMVRRNRAWDEREGLPADVQRAAYGRDGQGGCSKAARDQLGGGTAQPEYHAFNQLTSASLEAARRTPEVRSAKRKWSACMVRKGFRDALAAGAGKRWQTAGPTPAERETAGADVACKQETDLVAVWASAETRIQRRLIRQHAKELREAKARHDHWLAAARRVLNRAGG